MSKKLCRFNEEWLKDDRFKDWLEKDNSSVSQAKCRLCVTSFNLSNMGIRAVVSHSTGKKHLSFTTSYKTSNFFKTNQTPPASLQVAESSKTIESFLTSTSTLNSEILWALKVVTSHFSFRSCIGLNHLFKVMFPDSDIAKNFALGKTKCAYLINFGLSPFFKLELVNCIKSSPYFIASFDESLNQVTQNEQMDIQIRFWNESTGLAETRYLDSKFLKRPNAENLTTELNNALGELPTKNMLQLSMDGPRTNWNVLELLNNQRSVSEVPLLIDIGSCGLHVIHGAFRTGVEATTWNIKKVLKAMWQIFADSPARRDIYIRETKSEEFPLRYIYMENSLYSK